MNRSKKGGEPADDAQSSATRHSGRVRLVPDTAAGELAAWRPALLLGPPGRLGKPTTVAGLVTGAAAAGAAAAGASSGTGARTAADADASPLPPQLLPTKSAAMLPWAGSPDDLTAAGRDEAPDASPTAAVQAPSGCLRLPVLGGTVTVMSAPSSSLVSDRWKISA